MYFSQHFYTLIKLQKIVNIQFLSNDIVCRFHLENLV